MKLYLLGGIACSLLVACSSDDSSRRALLMPAPQDGVTPEGNAGSSGDPLATGGSTGEGEPDPVGLDGQLPPSSFGPGNNIAEVEDRGAGCSVPPLPAYAELTANPMLPDPFMSMDGSRITSKAEWTCRRAQIAAQVQQYELGPKPPAPQSVSGSLAGDVLTVTVEEGGVSVSLTATITLPTTGTAPFPAMITLGGGTSFDANQNISGRGVAMIAFNHDDVAAQQGGGSRGQGKFYELYGAQHPAGAMMAWAWGASRLIDALETTAEANIDATRLGVTGCSRNGKGALVVGAFDERIALTLPQESGAGGSSLWRMADVNQQAWLAAGMIPDYGAVQTLGQIVNENPWFRREFSQFSTTATMLPFDHHMVMGLVAPRAMLVINNTDQWWLDREGSHLGATTAHSVWEALGIGSNMGTSQTGGHPHCQAVPQAELDMVGAYVDKFLVGGGSASTDMLYTDGAFPDSRAQWIDWETPALE